MSDLSKVIPVRLPLTVSVLPDSEDASNEVSGETKTPREITLDDLSLSPETLRIVKAIMVDKWGQDHVKRANTLLNLKIVFFMSRVNPRKEVYCVKEVATELQLKLGLRFVEPYKDYSLTGCWEGLRQTLIQDNGKTFRDLFEKEG